MRHLIALVLAALTAPMSAPAVAQGADALRAMLAGEGASAWGEAPMAKVRLIAASGGTGEAGAVPLGLHFKLDPTWKVYWRSPGDAGLPPLVDWAGSENLAGMDMAFPAPGRFSTAGIETIGYEDEVVFPLTARLVKPGEPLMLKADVKYLVCSDVCVPARASLDLTLPGGPAPMTPHIHLLERFASQVPGDGARHGLAVTGAEADGAVLRVALSADPPLRAPDLFVEGPKGMSFAAPTVTLTEGGTKVVLETRAAAPGAPLDLAGKALTVTVVDGARGIEANVTPVEASIAWGALLGMLGVALLGGLILNLMPCVLPVLGLKLSGVLRQAGAARREIRHGFLLYSAGVIVSFLLLAAVAVALRSAGAAAGWGIQFQQPLFLAFMIVVLTLFAANLWGWYVLRAPSAVGDIAARGGVQTSAGGHFLTGAFATLMATPCSAPFLGTAVAFALSQGAVEVFLVFGALGLGMALPTIAVALWPGLVAMLPRPGRWMGYVTTLLGLLLLGTAVWLTTVLASQVGLLPALLVAMPATAILLVLGMRRGAILPGRVAWPTTALAGAAALAAGALAGTPDGGRDPLHTGPWVAFSQEEIPGLVAAGKVVVVDITADWCVTCKVNEALALSDTAVMERLASAGVVAMRADWTLPDPRITGYLTAHGRYGIPFLQVLGPGAPRGIVLPELLRAGTMLEALDQAAGPPGPVAGSAPR